MRAQRFHGSERDHVTQLEVARIEGERLSRAVGDPETAEAVVQQARLGQPLNHPRNNGVFKPQLAQLPCELVRGELALAEAR